MIYCIVSGLFLNLFCHFKQQLRTQNQPHTFSLVLLPSWYVGKLICFHAYFFSDLGA